MRGEAKLVYEEIRQELIRLHGNWLLYKQLFTVGEERYVVMNDTAPAFFRLIQDVLVDDAVMSLGRLTDPAHYQSLARLVKELKPQVRHTFFQELEQDYQALRLTCEDIREHRHKRVAHRARKTASLELRGGPSRLPPLTRKKIEGAMAAIAKFMNKVLGYFESVEELYEPVMIGDADSLVFYLEKGLEASRIE
jgi:hypothetical protein